jgi:hypothetical protein
VSRRDVATRSLRWYPASWRDRYGEELVALVAEESRGRRLPARTRVDLAMAGLRERVRATGLTRDAGEPREDVRLGALVVLSAWALFAIGGIGYQNLSENFQREVTGRASAISVASFDAIVAAAALAVLVVAAGAMVAVPSFLRFVRAGGWPSVRRRFRLAGAMTLAALGALAAIVPWAHSLTYAERNGTLYTYSLAVLGFAALTAASLALWTTASVGTARRLDFTERALAREGGLALALFVLMVVMTVAATVWWVSVGTAAPWFLQGTAPGTRPVPLSANLVVSVGCMAVATVVAAAGARRISARRAVLRAR